MITNDEIAPYLSSEIWNKRKYMSFREENNCCYQKKYTNSKNSDKMEKLKDVDMFLNDNYQILTIMYEHQQKINNQIIFLQLLYSKKLKIQWVIA